MDNAAKRRLLQQYKKADRIISLSNHRIRSLSKKKSALAQQIGEAEYGAIGSVISYKDMSKNILVAKILRFEESMWSEIPRCIVDTVIEGRNIETHLVNGEAILHG